jgi:hypothetical protein
MALQALERERPPQAPLVSRVVPITKTVSGFEGARIFTTLSGSFNLAEVYALSSNATSDVSLGGVYYAGASGYDPDFVTSILKADADAPEASFDNVVDMLDWLNRD